MSATAPTGSPARWASQNQYNMQKARALTANMLKQVRVNEAGERASKGAEMEQTAREKQQRRDAVFARAAAHGDVITTSANYMRDIEDGALQADNSIALLKQNRSLAFAALQVCKRRVQLRGRRPKPELVKDYVSIALESEMKLLEVAREEFLELELQGKQISQHLTSIRGHLSQDTGTRRLVMLKDQQSLRPHLQPPPEMQRPAPVIKEEDSQGLLQDTFSLLDRSTKHREKSLAVVKRIKDDSGAACLRVEDCLEKRTDELAALEKDLKQHQSDADAAIASAERSLDKSTKRLDPTDTQKKEKLIRDKALLDQLKAHKVTLHGEINNKFLALEIDNMCRRVTAVKACEPTLLDAQNAMQSGSRTPSSAGQLTSSSSAPNILSTAGANNMGMSSSKLPSLGGTQDSFKFSNKTKNSAFSQDLSALRTQ